MVDYVWLVLAGLRWVRLCYTKCEMLKCEKCPKESDFESEVHSNPVNGSPDNSVIGSGFSQSHLSAHIVKCDG